MQRILGLTAVFAAAVGVWAGVSAWQSASVMENVQAGLAIAIGVNLLFCLSLWYRAQRGSGDAMVLPTLVLLSASMLLGILPRLFWPAAEGLHIAGSIASILVTAVLVIMQIRRLRRLRRTARPV
jgi:hypothetical protein